MKKAIRQSSASFIIPPPVVRKLRARNRRQAFPKDINSWVAQRLDLCLELAWPARDEGARRPRDNTNDSFKKGEPEYEFRKLVRFTSEYILVTFYRTIGEDETSNILVQGLSVVMQTDFSLPEQ
ncbi:hypothetical protein NDU88_005979 [Pleurodeles waltl]|uniref:Uncharacterized protein n=1 Tax=Pleurodeles waltl TaxID=8319 RepID=A0AAV7WYM9_PLEWA|nr:hypothetical protein NDU88_005979 [Pleurodeles waltl]